MPLALVLAYAVLLLLVLLALLWSAWPRWMKALLVLGVTVLYFWGYDVVDGLLGTPSPGPLPERFVLLAAQVDEPTQARPGGIFLWVRAIEADQRPGAPRAYRIPYKRPVHEQVNEAMRRSRDGVQQMGTAQLRAESGRGVGGWLKPGADEQEIKLRDLPQSQLPEK